MGRDLPKRKMAELFNANHFIVSQANPVIVHFIDQRRQYMNSRGKWLTKTAYYLTKLIASEFSFRLQQLINMKILSKGIVRFLNLFLQDYSGHITIKFSPSIGDYSCILRNPSKELTSYFRDQGLRASFTEMSKIRVFLKIEKAISQAIRQIKGDTGMQSRKLSVIKEQDREDSIKTDRTHGRCVELDRQQDDIWKYINNLDEKNLESPFYSPSSKDNYNMMCDDEPIYRKKSGDSFSSLTSLGGTLR